LSLNIQSENNHNQSNRRSYPTSKGWNNAKPIFRILDQLNGSVHDSYFLLFVLILKSIKGATQVHKKYVQEIHLARRRRKISINTWKLEKNLNQRQMSKGKESWRKNLLIPPPSVRGLLNSDHFSPSKYTTWGKIEPSSTFQHSKAYKIALSSKQKSLLLVYA